MRRLLFAMSLMAAATSMSYAQVAKPAEKGEAYSGWTYGRCKPCD